MELRKAFWRERQSSGFHSYFAGAVLLSEKECDLLDTTETSLLSSKPKLPLPVITGEFTFLPAGTQDAKLAKIVAAYKGVYLKEGIKSSLLAPNVD